MFMVISHLIVSKVIMHGHCVLLCVSLTCGHVTVSLTCRALWSCDCQSDVSGFVVMRLSV